MRVFYKLETCIIHGGRKKREKSDPKKTAFVQKKKYIYIHMKHVFILKKMSIYRVKFSAKSVYSNHQDRVFKLKELS